MTRNQKLESIANGLRSAVRVRSVQNSSTRNSGDKAVEPAYMDLLSEMLKIAAQYSFSTYRKPLGEACEKCDRYFSTYRSLRHHLNSTRSETLNKEKFVNTLRILEPVLGAREKQMIFRILKLYEVFQ